MKANPHTAWNPARLDIRAFARAGAHLQAEQPVAQFGRLNNELHRDLDAGGAMPAVRWQARGELRPAASGGEPSIWLHLQAGTAVPLTCQRCLGPVQIPLVVDRWFRFVADEATAEAEDEDCEEDLLALEPRPNLHDLLEDELLMALPLVPMHDTCPVAVPMQAGDPAVAPGDGEVAQRKNPFAGLAGLKK